jgi:DNA-binding beta-propeller fold protein YncE
MFVVFSRRALVLSVAFAATACSGPASTSVAPGNPTLGSARAANAPPASQAAHKGVPFAVGAPQGHAVHAQADYPIEHPLLFVSNESSNAVAVYALRLIRRNRNPIAQLPSTSGCPAGIAEDKRGAIYVAQNCPPNGNVVDIFPRGSTTPSREITTGISAPLGVAIDAQGDLYVSNYPAAITVYPPGATSPSETITGGGLTDPFGLAFDSHGNLFIADFGASQVFEIQSGTTTPVPLNLQDMTEPLQLAIDKADNMYVTDGEGDQVQVYLPGSTTPIRTLTADFKFPYGIAINEMSDVFVSDITNDEVYAFHPGAFAPYARQRRGINLPTALLAKKI